MEDRGIIYIAIGDEYRMMAIQSAQSIIDLYVSECPQITILTTDSGNFRISPYISLRQINGDFSADPAIATAYLKTRLYFLSEFTKTLYLDCDTRAVGNLSGIWDYLGNSIAVAPAYNPLSEYTVYPRNPEATKTSMCLSKINDYTQYNTGVLLFRRTLNIYKIFELWRKEWCEFQHHENMAFTRLVCQGFNVDYLPSKYNQFYSDADKHSILIHYVGGYKRYLEIS